MAVAIPDCGRMDCDLGHCQTRHCVQPAYDNRAIVDKTHSLSNLGTSISSVKVDICPCRLCSSARTVAPFVTQWTCQYRALWVSILSMTTAVLLIDAQHACTKSWLGLHCVLGKCLSSMTLAVTCSHHPQVDSKNAIAPLNNAVCLQDSSIMQMYYAAMPCCSRQKCSLCARLSFLSKSSRSFQFSAVRANFWCLRELICYH